MLLYLFLFKKVNVKSYQSIFQNYTKSLIIITILKSYIDYILMVPNESLVTCTWYFNLVKLWNFP